MNGDNNISLLYFLNSYYLYPESLVNGNFLTLYFSKASHPPKILKTALREKGSLAACHRYFFGRGECDASYIKVFIR